MKFLHREIHSFEDAQRNFEQLEGKAVLDPSLAVALGNLLGAAHSSVVTGTLSWPGGTPFSTSVNIALAGAATVNGLFIATGNINNSGLFVDSGFISTFPGIGTITIAGSSRSTNPALGCTMNYVGLIWG